MRTLILLAMLSLIVTPAFAQKYISWEAEDFNDSNGTKFEVFNVPTDHPGTPDADPPVEDYSPTEASGGAYIGSHNGTANDGGDWVKYEFTVEADNWHFWGRVIAPSISDNSVFWVFDAADGDVESANNATMNIWDFFEVESLRVNYTTDWVWFRLNTRDGPFEGTELVQHGDDPVPVELDAGDHTLHIAHRESGTYIDKLFATTDVEFDPNETDPQTAVEAQNKLTTTWGSLKSGF
jgi:hypothetical protein